MFLDENSNETDFIKESLEHLADCKKALDNFYSTKIEDLQENIEDMQSSVENAIYYSNKAIDYINGKSIVSIDIDTKTLVNESLLIKYMERNEK